MSVDLAGAWPLTVQGDAPLSDAQLMRQIIEGSQDALAGLYDRHADAIFAVALRASRDRWIAAEVVQDTFVVLWNRAEQYDPSRGALGTWLSAIARNRTTDRLRSAGRHERAATFSSFARSDDLDDQSIAEWVMTSGALIGAAGPEPGPEIALSMEETRASIAAAIASLNPMERSVIELAYDVGLSQSEIAERLGWPIGTVKTRTRRALRHLRDQLEEADASMSVADTAPGTTVMNAEPSISSRRGASSPSHGAVKNWGSAVGSTGLAPAAAPCHC